MKTNTPTAALLPLALAGMLSAAPAFAHSPAEHAQHAAHAAPASHAAHAAHSAPAPAMIESVPVKLSGKPLLDQEGRSVRLTKDVFGERVAVVAFGYTSCTTVCPTISATLAELQTKLGERLDRDVRLVSLTVDPETDTPERIKRYSSLFDAKPGWVWLTGKPADVTDALKGFGAYTPKFENHPVIVLIGDPKSGKWSRHYAMAKSDTLLARIDHYLAARQPVVASAHRH